MHAREFNRESSAMRAVGYKQAIAFLMGEMSYDEFVSRPLLPLESCKKAINLA